MSNPVTLDCGLRSDMGMGGGGGISKGDGSPGVYAGTYFPGGGGPADEIVDPGSRP